MSPYRCIEQPVSLEPSQGDCNGSTAFPLKGIPIATKEHTFFSEDRATTDKRKTKGGLHFITDWAIRFLSQWEELKEMKKHNQNTQNLYSIFRITCVHGGIEYSPPPPSTQWLKKIKSKTKNIYSSLPWCVSWHKGSPRIQKL